MVTPLCWFLWLREPFENWLTFFSRSFCSSLLEDHASSIDAEMYCLSIMRPLRKFKQLWYEWSLKNQHLNWMNCPNGRINYLEISLLFNRFFGEKKHQEVPAQPYTVLQQSQTSKHYIFFSDISRPSCITWLWTLIIQLSRRRSIIRTRCIFADEHNQKFHWVERVESSLFEFYFF